MIMCILKNYRTAKELKNGEFTELKSYHWENPAAYRPQTYFNFGIVDGSLTAVLKCCEETPKAIYENRDDPVYKDSCLEFFVLPFTFSRKYINVECNSRGTFLCEVGEGKFDRTTVRTLTEHSPEVVPFREYTEKGVFWGVQITLTKDFLSEIFCIDKDKIKYTTVKANFYKCGDECENPHYIAFSPVTTLPPGFHNPECFAVFENEEK